ncbi:hypothetical protein PT2222_30390 [Paraburkholderia tropica]
MEVERAAVRGGNAGRVLTAMLQEQQRVIEELVDGRAGNYAYDAAHGRSFKKAKSVTAREQSDRGGRSSPAGVPRGSAA